MPRKKGRSIERAVKTALLPLAVRLFPPRRHPAAIDPRAAHEVFPAICRMRARPRFLVVRQDNRLGNLVLISPFLQALRAAAPDGEITILTGDGFAELYERSSWNDRLIVERKRWLIRHPWAYPALLRSVREGDWDATFEISNADTHSFNNALMTAVSGAPIRIGFDHERSRAALNIAVDPPYKPCHYSLAPLLLLAAIGCRPDVFPMRLSQPLIEQARRRLGGRETASEIVIHVGGRGPKGWPAARWERLIERLTRANVGPLRVIGGSGERAQIEQLARSAGTTRAGRTDQVAQTARAGQTDQVARTAPTLAAEELHDLPGLVATLLRARLYIGCDAGPLHVAAAAGVPTVSLFLQSDPLRYAPLGQLHEAIIGGRGSRAWIARDSAAAAQEAPPAGPDRAFVSALCDQRPNYVEMGLEAGPDEEVAFVGERILAALNRLDRIPPAPAAVSR